MRLRASQTQPGQPLQAPLRTKPNREAENQRKGAVVYAPNQTWPAFASSSESQNQTERQKICEKGEKCVTTQEERNPDNANLASLCGLQAFLRAKPNGETENLRKGAVVGVTGESLCKFL